MPAIVKRLERQLAAKGEKNPVGMAIAILKKNKILDKQGNLTSKGKKRQAMGNAGRAKDRAAKASHGKHKAKDYKYNSKTNSATLRK